MESIMRRRSIRKFSRDPIPQDTVNRLLDAADAAPCAKGLRSWHFIVIDDRSILDKVPKMHPYSKMILEAPMAILVCGDSSIESVEGYWVQNCSAATENILIAAASMDLGSVWLGVYPREQRIKGVKDLIPLPDHIIPFSLIVLGRPNETKSPHGAHDSSRVHWNQW
jgi:nitroreductase